MDAIEKQTKEAAIWLYQNKEHQAYDWIQQHLNDIQMHLLEILQRLENYPGINYQEVAQLVVIILQRILQFYQQGKILELADCLYFEISEFEKLEELCN